MPRRLLTVFVLDMGDPDTYEIILHQPRGVSQQECRDAAWSAQDLINALLNNGNIGEVLCNDAQARATCGTSPQTQVSSTPAPSVTDTPVSVAVG